MNKAKKRKLENMIRRKEECIGEREGNEEEEQENDLKL
jgi:hypothetical protein